MSLGANLIDLDFDRQHIWHPYTSLSNPLPVYPVVSAQGVNLTLEDGTTLIDGMASWWSAIHGYNHPVLNQALTDQAKSMSHVMFGGLTHPAAVDLAKSLIALTPEGLNRIFFSDSGSVSIDVAIKMALQYWAAKKKPERKRLLTIRGGYHGDTFAAMSVCDPVTGMHNLFTGTLIDNFFAPRPNCRFGEPCKESDIESFKALISQHKNELAAVILEPIVQGAGGMYFYSADYLRKVKLLCEENQILLIADEIATGFGRTGTMFACEHADIQPDILCLGKALTGGYMSLAATLCSDELSSTISSEGPLMHGPTFMANPLACAVANASIQLLLDSPWQQIIARLQAQLLSELSPAAHLPAVNNVRVLGGIGVIEMKESIDMAAAQHFFVKNGVWLRPFGKRLYIMPPYIISPSELSKLTELMVEFAAG